MPAIETHDLARAFGSHRALDGLDLEVEAGEVVALLGPNGAGKTTTVRLLNGLLVPDRGWSRVLGLDPATDGDDIRARTGVLTENAGLDDRLTAVENLLASARIRHVPHPRRRVQELLDRFGMAARGDDVVQGFSTGQRKRVALARALLHDPDVLFLDEPTSGLDPEATRDVIDLIEQLAREHGRTVILATHFLGEAGRLADRMAVLHEGRLLAFGSPAGLAAELWDGLPARVDLGHVADPATVAVLAAVAGVVEVEPTAEGARLTVRDRGVLPAVVAALVGHEVPVYECRAEPPTLEDVYFRVLGPRRAAAQEAAGTAVPGPGPWG